MNTEVSEPAADRDVSLSAMLSDETSSLTFSCLARVEKERISREPCAPYISRVCRFTTLNVARVPAAIEIEERQRF